MPSPSGRELVLRSLIAVSEAREAEFYAQLFQNQAPEQFAMIVVGSRCLVNPLRKSLISDLKILSNLDLTPLLVVGALYDNTSLIAYDAQKLAKEMEAAGIVYDKLNCASYQLAGQVRKSTKMGKIPILELSHPNQGLDLDGLIDTFRPGKVIFLKPSGGLVENGKRITVLKIDDIPKVLASPSTSPGQARTLELIQSNAQTVNYPITYVLASPLNLLSELFTVKGAGTLIRRNAKIISGRSYTKFQPRKISASIESAFGKPLKPDFMQRKPSFVFMEENYRGGAIFFHKGGAAYMSKFWVTREAQGEGIAKDIWDSINQQIRSFYWRSRGQNQFNEWYMRVCDGMQISGDWRVFWRGLQAENIARAIEAASQAPIDFEDLSVAIAAS